MRLSSLCAAITKYGWGALGRQKSNFVSRTVMVRDNNVEEGLKVLNGLVANEGILARWKITRR